MNKPKVASFLIRLGLAVVLIYAAIAAWQEPLAWIGFVPPWVEQIMPATTFLDVFGIYQVLLGLWLLWGKWQKYSGALTALTIAGVVLGNLAQWEIVFRDVPMVLSALALLFL